LRAVAQKERWTVLKVLRWTTEFFQKKGVRSPRLDAEVLLAYLLGTDRVGLYLDHDKPLKEEELAAFREMIQRRIAGEPVAYITGEKEFWSLSFKVTPACLIPRPETEVLVEEAIRAAADAPHPLRILDIGTGCGAVAIALAKELAESEVWATDRSPYALEVAKENVERHGVGERVRLVEADLFPKDEGQFSLIVSNPPYIPTEEVLRLDPEVRDYEPLEALDGGPDGLKYLRRIAEGAPLRLRPGGWLLLEVGKGQAEEVQRILVGEGFSPVETVRDYTGVKRVVKGRWRE